MSNNWKKYKLGDVVKIVDSLHKTPTYSAIGLPMVRVQNIDGGIMKLDGCIPVSQDVFDEFSRKHKSQKGDLVFSRVGAYSGKASIVKQDLNFCLGQNTAYIIPHQVNSEFLFYLINSVEIQRALNISAVVSSYKTISLKSLKDLLITLPPLSEQEAIAEVLTSLDDKIELNLQTNRTLEEMANALYKHWFVDFGPFKEAKFVESELGMIPEGWNIRTLKEFGEIVCGKTPSKTDSQNFGNTYPFIKIPDMHHSLFILDTQDGLSEIGHNTQPKKLIPENSVIVSSIATVGLVSLNIYPSHTNQQINVIIPSEKKDYTYLYFACKNLKEEFLNLASGGSATLNMNTTTFAGIKIIAAPNQIRNRYFEQVAFMFDKIKNNIIQNKTLKQTRDYLLPKLISGEIRVKEAANSVKQLI